jgi:hypothetical protein
MAKNPLKTINEAAKKLRAAHPSMSYATAQKKAGAAYRQGTISGIGGKRKKASKAKKGKRLSGTGKPKYKVTHVVQRIAGVTYKGGSVSIKGTPQVESTKNKLRHQLAEQSGWLDLALSQEKGARKKSQLRKEKARVLREMRQIK